MPEGRDVFLQSRNEMGRALRDAGVDPLITGSVLMHFEQLGFFLMGLQAQIRRLQQDVTRQDTRQTRAGQPQPTEAKPQSAPTLSP